MGCIFLALNIPTRTDSVQKVCCGIRQSFDSLAKFWYPERVSNKFFKSYFWGRKSARIKKFIKLKKFGHPQIMLGGSGQSWILRSFGWSKMSKQEKMWNRQIVFCIFFCKNYLSNRCQNLHSLSHQYYLKRLFNEDVSIVKKNENESFHNNTINTFYGSPSKALDWTSSKQQNTRLVLVQQLKNIVHWISFKNNYCS